MEKTKLLKGALALVLMGMVAAPTQAFASSTGSGIAEVSYNNDGTIPDPENPSDPKWVVKIPTAIVFTNSQKSVSADVKLEGTGGNSVPTDKEIAITVTSKNNYALNAAGVDKDPMAYGLTYANTLMSATVNEVGTLDGTTTEIKGTAVLNSNAVAKVAGSHTDILTYSVAVTTITIP